MHLNATSFTYNNQCTKSKEIIKSLKRLTGLDTREYERMNASVKNTLLVTAGAAATLAGSTVVASADSITVKAGDTLYALAAAHNTTVADLVSANGLSNGNMIFVGQQLQLPGSSNNAASNNANNNTANPAATGTYTVKAGDSLWAIANNHGMNLSELLSLNDLQMSSTIHPGDTLKLSGQPAADNNQTSNDSQADSSANTQAPASNGQYTVKAGDSLWAIANSHGMSLTDLLNLNGLQATSMIHPGDILRVSGDASSANTDNNASASQNNDAANNNDYTNSGSVSTTNNTYPYGQCTWYVKGHLDWVGNWWGNAADWTTSAVNAGHHVDSTPSAGSVIWFTPGVGGVSVYGHVGVVESVNADGSITISEGNYAPGMLYHQRTISPAGHLFIHK